jgi:CheY-like chemotaxis protein
MTMPRVLLVDDTDSVRDMLQIALERDGFEVVAEATVSGALRRIATERFDVLLPICTCRMLATASPWLAPCATPTRKR